MTERRFIRMDAAGPELRCPYCLDWWPLTAEWWIVNRDGSVRADRCRVCERERSRLYQALRRTDPAFRLDELRRSRRYRTWLRRHEPSLVGAYDAMRREEKRAYKRAWDARRAA